MPNLPISGLPAAGALTGAELTVLVQSGVTVQSTVADAAAFAIAAGQPPYGANRWYPFINGIASPGLGVVSRAHFSPFTVRQVVTLSDMGVLLTTASAGGAFQLAIYDGDQAAPIPTGLPLAYTSNTLSTTSAAIVSGALNTNIQLVPGHIYWTGLACDNNTATFQALSTSDPSNAAIVGAQNLSEYIFGSNNVAMFWSIVYAYSDLATLDLTATPPTISGGVLRQFWLNFRALSSP